MLILVLQAKNSAYGKAVQTGFNIERGTDEKKSDDCPLQKDSRFPLSVKVDINISSTKHATKVGHDVNNRSMSPWDYRYSSCPHCLEMHWALPKHCLGIQRGCPQDKTQCTAVSRNINFDLPVHVVMVRFLMQK